ncbi:FAD/NAD(P)-binding protein [Microcoleus sp. PH2017_28_MFU_U_A]|uniref:FAD/NAD(P)-binding protein n=1 Tax=Microcoleus sp. PH2017_28_MFU_U_A TaxID=2798838 RepID=UPI001DC7688C|nr:FAD/NAD(P)-binding protein [Microcoleus sp. PH2017_28_MFU_U_A]MCC3593444.1 SidA/IucD/PvdA family monooxygenase [Microcoleus sp. PH2017_28_MFU_U_A]
MEITSVTRSQIDLAVVGAGPHALTLVTHLLQKCQKKRDKFWVFDPSGGWLTQWERQFAALEIPHLRSPAVHHPDPNAFELRRFAESRPNELFAPYDLPGSRLFKEFCGDVVKRWELGDRVIKAKITRIEPLQRSFRLWFEDGESAMPSAGYAYARRVAIATGGGKPQLPEWTNQIQTPYPPDKLCHSHQVNLQGLKLQGERILIVGGGLTSGHLAVGAIGRGAQVILMSRRKLQEKLFDAEPGWLGPKYLKGFENEPDWEKRWEMIQQARNGGSMTPEIMTQLRRISRDSCLEFHPECQIIEVKWDDNQWTVYCQDGNQLFVDRIWLATGTKLDVTAEPLLTEILEAYPTKIVKGLPVLDEYLRWPGCELFIMGGLAALQVGPVGRNLSGARMASSRIVPALIKSRARVSLAQIAG